VDTKTPDDAPAYGASAHYDGDYFAWQNANIEIKNKIKIGRFVPYVQPEHTVLDFGCAGGGVLAMLNCARRIGVELNDVAREAAVRDHGIEAYRSLDEVPDGIVDVAISNHALEHIASPYEVLCRIRSKLRPDGRLVLVLPIDDWRAQRRWDPNDINHHLYTWTPLLLGNLLQDAGFVPEHTRIIHRTLMRGFERFARLPDPVFQGISWLYSHLRHRQELLAVARPAGSP
jgi:SAM-dependent methyltransferase